MNKKNEKKWFNFSATSCIRVNLFSKVQSQPSHCKTPYKWWVRVSSKSGDFSAPLFVSVCRMFSYTTQQSAQQKTKRLLLHSTWHGVRVHTQGFCIIWKHKTSKQQKNQRAARVCELENDFKSFLLLIIFLSLQWKFSLSNNRGWNIEWFGWFSSVKRTALPKTAPGCCTLKRERMHTHTLE